MASIWDNSPYLAIEFIEGQTLEEVLAEQGRLTLPQFFATFVEASEAIDCAHRTSVNHRDIKPGNIMLFEDGVGMLKTKVVDFGIAKNIDATTAGAQFSTRHGQLMGTPLYMNKKALQISDQAVPYLKIKNMKSFVVLGSLQERIMLLNHFGMAKELAEYEKWEKQVNKEYNREMNQSLKKN